MKRIRVRFCWFGKEFDSHNNLLVDILKASDFDVINIRGGSSDCEIEFVGTYKPVLAKIEDKVRFLARGNKSGTLAERNSLPSDYQLSTSNFRRRIWYTSENLRPPVQEGFDGSLSFDQDEFRGFNAYCPSWYQNVGVARPKFSRALGEDSILTLLKAGRKKNTNQSSRIGGFINDRNPLSSFTQQEFSRTSDLDLFYIQTRKPLYEIAQINKQFKYFLCSEVDFYPGYVSSILFQAYLAGAVPIYFGDIGSDVNLNRNAFISSGDFLKVTDLVSYVYNLDSKAYAEIYEQPLLLQQPSLSKIVDVILG